MGKGWGMAGGVGDGERLGEDWGGGGRGKAGGGLGGGGGRGKAGGGLGGWGTGRADHSCVGFGCSHTHDMSCSYTSYTNMCIPTACTHMCIPTACTHMCIPTACTHMCIPTACTHLLQSMTISLSKFNKVRLLGELPFLISTIGCLPRVEVPIRHISL